MTKGIEALQEIMKNRNEAMYAREYYKNTGDMGTAIELNHQVIAYDKSIEVLCEVFDIEVVSNQVTSNAMGITFNYFMKAIKERG